MIVEPIRDPEEIETEHLKNLNTLQGRNILEIGCGSGRLTQRYAPLAAAITALDPDPERLAQALADKSQYPDIPVSFLQADAVNLPFPNGRFDAAIFAWSL